MGNSSKMLSFHRCGLFPYHQTILVIIWKSFLVQWEWEAKLCEVDGWTHAQRQAIKCRHLWLGAHFSWMYYFKEWVHTLYTQDNLLTLALKLLPYKDYEVMHQDHCHCNLSFCTVFTIYNGFIINYPLKWASFIILHKHSFMNGLLWMPQAIALAFAVRYCNILLSLKRQTFFFCTKFESTIL